MVTRRRVPADGTRFLTQAVRNANGLFGDDALGFNASPAGKGLPRRICRSSPRAQKSVKVRRGKTINRAAPQETSTCLRSLSQALVAFWKRALPMPEDPLRTNSAGLCSSMKPGAECSPGSPSGRACRLGPRLNQPGQWTSPEAGPTQRGHRGLSQNRTRRDKPRSVVWRSVEVGVRLKRARN